MSGQQTDQAAPQQSGGPPAGTLAKVDVFARTGPAGKVQFSHRWRWNDGAAGGKGTIDVPKRKKDEDGTPIHFRLVDRTEPKRRLVFTDDECGPIWVQRDTCPPEDQACFDTEIPKDEIKLSSPKLLKVLDLNSEACTLCYRLRFTDEDGCHESYDPAIKNGGTT